jgi:hypothetical protein
MIRFGTPTAQLGGRMDLLTLTALPEPQRLALLGGVFILCAVLLRKLLIRTDSPLEATSHADMRAK